MDLFASNYRISDRFTSAIEKGESYLLARIRAQELATRAPEDSPHKWCDGYGESFLAIDVIHAVGDKLPQQDRQSLAARILSARWKDAWGYRSARGIDADTTASAMRALVLLGQPVSPKCLNRFFNAETNLFNTFARSKDKLGLQFPPQTPVKHFGAHPCVLANVYLALHSGGELPCLSHELLRRMQKADGTWFSYYYPSPFYSTRLYCDLLSSLGQDFVPYLQLTLNGLLVVQPTGSSMRDAEVLICLARLRRRLAPDRPEIINQGHRFLEQIVNRQLDDGSWPGEIIWRFLHRDNSGFADGFDYFRVTSTSLCVRALKLWSEECGY